MSQKVTTYLFTLGDTGYTFTYSDNIKRVEESIQRAGCSLSMVSHGGITAEACANANIAGYDMTQDRAFELQRDGCSISFKNVRAECIVTGYYDAFKMLMLHDRMSEDALVNAWRCLTAGCNNNVEQEGTKYRNGNLIDPIRGFDSSELDTAMTKFLEYYNTDVDYEEVLSRALVLSWLFERISPFGDGNARMSRLLIYDYCMRHGYNFIIDYPITKTLNEMKKEYKAVLCNNPISSDCNKYVEFMLDVINKTVN